MKKQGCILFSSYMIFAIPQSIAQLMFRARLLSLTMQLTSQYSLVLYGESPCEQLVYEKE